MSIDLLQIGGISSSSVSALTRLTQQSYQFCLHFCLSRLQSEHDLRQSRFGLQEQGKSAVSVIDNPHPRSEQSKRIPKTPSVVSP